MAVEVSRHPSAWPCETCDCVNGIAPEPRWHTPGHIRPTATCYRQAVDDRSYYLLRLFSQYRLGTLYAAGGLRDQPALYLQAMTFIAGYLNVNKD